MKEIMISLMIIIGFYKNYFLNKIFISSIEIAFSVKIRIVYKIAALKIIIIPVKILNSIKYVNKKRYASITKLANNGLIIESVFGTIPSCFFEKNINIPIPVYLLISVAKEAPIRP